MRPRALFVTDIDGTLLTWAGEVPPASLEALRAADEAGIALAVATGRRRTSFRKDCRRLGDLRYRVSLSNGAVLLAPDNETPARVHAIPWEAALELARAAGADARSLLAITAPHEGDEAGTDCFVVRSGDRVVAARSPWAPETYREASLAEARAHVLVHAALHVGSREVAESLEPLARGLFAGEDVEVHSVKSPGGGGALLEVVVAGGKGRGVRDLAEELDLAPGAIGAIGDDMNDARLLEAAGHRYAVGGSVLAERRSDAVEVARAEDAAVADALARFRVTLGLG